MTYKLIAATTLRAHFADALKTVLGSRNLLLVTKKNKPVSALLDIDFLEDLLAAASPEYVESIREAREDYRKGRVVGHEQIFGKL